MSRLTGFLDHITGRQSPVPPDVGGFGLDTGHSQEQFAPDKYGDYIATSNDFYSAAMLRAKAQAKLDIDFYDSAGAVVDGGDVARLLNYVNPYWTRRRLTVQYQLSMATWGQCYMMVEKNQRGIPRELWWAKPTRVKPVVSSSDYLSGYVYTPKSGKPIRFDTDEVIWFRYPNIIDEFTGLAPLAAARLAADFSSSALKANVNLFDQGMMMGGAFFPPKDTELSKPQADDLEEKLSRRFRGVDKAHRWAVFKHDFRMEKMGVSAKDAEFIDGMNLSFRQVCRALGVPSALLNDGEFATLSNMVAYQRQLWDDTMEFEAGFFTDELVEQLLPMFRGTRIVNLAYNLDNISALQEDKKLREEREAAQIKDGRLTVNEWRDKNGMEPVVWGDVWWKHALYVPAEDYTLSTNVDNADRGTNTRGVDRFKSDEDRFAKTMRAIYARQLDSVISTLNRTVNDAVEAPFNMARWITEYERAGEPLLMSTITKTAVTAASQVGVDLSDDLSELEGLATAVDVQAGRQAAEFAKTANETLWNELRSVIGDGLDNGDTVEGLTARIHRILGPDSAEWRARRIAATETTKAVSWGDMEVWRMTDVKEKTWVTQQDGNVRDSHVALEGVTIRIDDAFQVGTCLGDAPGLTGCASEDIHCRCRVKPVTGRTARLESGLKQIDDVLGVYT